MRRARLKLASLDEGMTSLISAVMIALGPVSLSLYTPGLPTLVAAFHTTPAAVRASLTIYFFGFCMAQLLCGPLSDAFGRRPVALVFFSLYLAGSVVCLLAPTIEALQAGRALQGVGAAAGISTARAIVRDLFTGQASARIMNRIGLLVGIVPALSPAAGSLLLTYVGWQAIFVVMFIYAIVVFATVVFIIPETNHTIDPALARPRRILASYGALLSDRNFMGPSMVMGFVLGGLYTLPSLLPFVLIGDLGLSPMQYGLMMILQTASLLIANVLVGRLLRHISAKRLVPIGIAFILLAGAGFLTLSFLGPRNVALVVMPAAIWVFGLPFVTPGTMTAALSHVPRTAGAASSLIGFMQMGGGFVGSALAAALFKEPVAALGALLPITACLACFCYLVFPMESSHSGREDGGDRD